MSDWCFWAHDSSRLPPRALRAICHREARIFCGCWPQARPAVLGRLRKHVQDALVTFYALDRPYKCLPSRFLHDKVLRANGCGRLCLPVSGNEEELWAAMCRRCPRLTGRSRAASVIQRNWRAQRHKHAAARRIQAGCRRWIHEPRTRDGKLGINLRILIRMDLRA